MKRKRDENEINEVQPDLTEDAWGVIRFLLSPDSAILLALTCKRHHKAVKLMWKKVELLFLKGCRSCGSNDWMHSCYIDPAYKQCLPEGEKIVVRLFDGPHRIERVQVTSLMYFKPTGEPDSEGIFTLLLPTPNPINPSWGSGYTGNPVWLFFYNYHNQSELWSRNLQFPWRDDCESHIETASGIPYFRLIWADDKSNDYNVPLQ